MFLGISLQYGGSSVERQPNVALVVAGCVSKMRVLYVNVKKRNAHPEEALIRCFVGKA